MASKIDKLFDSILISTVIYETIILNYEDTNTSVPTAYVYEVKKIFRYIDTVIKKVLYWHMKEIFI